MDDNDIAALAAVLFLLALTIAVYPGQLFGLAVYTPLFLLVLGFFGIQGLAKLKKVTIKDLLPGILTNMEIIGIAGIVSISWLYMMAIMPMEQYWTLLRMIFAALGISFVTHYLLTRR